MAEIKRHVLGGLDPNAIQTKSSHGQLSQMAQPKAQNRSLSCCSPVVGCQQERQQHQERHQPPPSSTIIHPEPTSQDHGAPSTYDQFLHVCDNRVDKDFVGLVDYGYVEWSLRDFVVLETVGTGGAATVYKVREKQSGYIVALKVQEVDEFMGEEEVIIHGSLQHPKVVAMYGFFYTNEKIESGGDKPESTSDESVHSDVVECDDEEDRMLSMLYIILEYCDGGSLLDVLCQQINCRLDEATAARYFIDAVEAVEYLHDQCDTIHSDIKPANFCLSGRDGCLKLMDFGFALQGEERDLLGGTAPYMSPEMLSAWRSHSMDFDKRSDIYSLGVVLYEIVVGEVPFDIVDDVVIGSNPFLFDSVSWADKSRASNNDLDPSSSSNLPDVSKLSLKEDTLRVPQLPPLYFPCFVSKELKSLMAALLHADRCQRISLSEAKFHPWVQKHLSQPNQK